MNQNLMDEEPRGGGQSQPEAESQEHSAGRGATARRGRMASGSTTRTKANQSKSARPAGQTGRGRDRAAASGASPQAEPTAKRGETAADRVASAADTAAEGESGGGRTRRRAAAGQGKPKPARAARPATKGRGRAAADRRAVQEAAPAESLIDASIRGGPESLVEPEVVEPEPSFFEAEVIGDELGAEGGEVSAAESTEEPRDREGAEGHARRDPRRGGRGERDDRRRYRDERRTSEIEPGSAPPPTRPGVMVVNDTPGEECRIAILRDGVLEQLFMERATTATQVGNIYKGRVTNVEPAIQAAFVDYGQGQAGFLHISDLHPKYFPRGDKTERVGKKIPRRDRPLMQEALRRGDEVIVQVLKQGIGTKGPTLTSYLSIAGRLLVMMPWMDKSGVSRKVDDEDQRREMRQILDSLNLPDGFGFILRTAGFERTKMELQRDAAYLLRLWKVMEKRMKAVGAPCALYTESDLLIRTIRDVVDSSIDTIVVDSESAFTRASTFLQVVAPRSAPKVLFYDRQVPIFHAFDIERQIELTHSRIVPLRSGGALVIDQTEALVAIDVNSGKSRAARDSETNAYQTNIEAVEEIARQLRLRDLGGVVICDLIDMRAQRHRRDIEERFRQHLRRDRARATTAPISDFGILEMTRQRMRPSLRKTHYIDCPHCDGHGEIKMPDAVAGDALRSIAHLLHYDRVKRVEMACSTRVASILLSGRRRMIDELEDRSGKRVEIRISEALALDRVDLYAYDDRGADIDITKLPAVSPPKLGDLAAEVVARPEIEETEDEPRGRRRRRRKPAPADATTIALEGGFDDLALELGETPSAEEPAAKEPAEEPQPRAAEAPRGRDGRRGRDRRRERQDVHRGERPAGGPQRGTDDGRASGSERREGAAAVRPVGQVKPQSAAPKVAAGAGADGATGQSETDGERRRRRRRRKGGLRLGELAREAGVPVRDLILRCRLEKIFNLQDELSRVPSEQAAMIRGWYGVVEPAVTGQDGEQEFEESDEIEERDEGEGEGAPARPAVATPMRSPRGADEAPLAVAQGDGPTAQADAKPHRVFELAKELGVPSKELVARCLENAVEGVKSHMASLSAEACATVRSWYAAPSPKPVARPTEKPAGRPAARPVERSAEKPISAPVAARDSAPRSGAERAGASGDGQRARPGAGAEAPVAIAAPSGTQPLRPAAPPTPARSFRPLYAAGRSRKAGPAPRDADRRE